MIRILYQPVSIEHINKNSKIIRNCNDRFDAMLSFCQERYGQSLSEKHLIDIGSCYGYFLENFKPYCKSIKGIELKESTFKVCQIFYPNVVEFVSKEDFTETIEFYEEYDIVCLLSVMHHIIINEGVMFATEMLHLIDQKTKDVMFFEMAEENENLYEEELIGWNLKSTVDWILENTTFDSYKELMQDQDEGVGRTLFAFYRNEL